MTQFLSEMSLPVKLSSSNQSTPSQGAGVLDRISVTTTSPGKGATTQ